MKMKTLVLALMLALALPMQAHASVKCSIDHADQGFVNEIDVSSSYGTKVGDKLTITAPTMANGEAVVNTTDDTIELNSDDNDLIVRMYSPKTSNGTVSLDFVGDAGADATDRFRIKNDAAGNLSFASDDTTPGTYVEKANLDSTGAFTVEGSEATAGSIAIWSDNGDDAADKFKMSMSAADTLTATTGAVTAYTIDNAGLFTVAAETVTGATLLNGAATLGDAITDITTFTGKIAGATPMSFDGTTADTVYTIFAITDPTSSSKTITFPAVTGTVKLNTATVVITAGTTPTLTVPAGVDFIATDTITTDNQDQTITFSSGGTAGQRCTLLFQTDSGGSNDEVITLQTTLTNTTGTLTLANLTAGRYSLELVSDGTVWNETNRTGALS